MALEKLLKQIAMFTILINLVIVKLFMSPSKTNPYKMLDCNNIPKKLYYLLALVLHTAITASKHSVYVRSNSSMEIGGLYI